MLRDTLPHGYRRTPSSTGLLVPEDTPRPRQVWTKDEVRLHDRFVALMHERGLKIAMKCGKDGCDGELTRLQGNGGEYIFRCSCTDRVFQRKH